jgi:hypothetical protein
MADRLTYAILATLLVASAVAGTASLKRDDMTGQDSTRIEKVFSKTRSICVGRYLIDVPLDAEVIFGPVSVPYRIERYPTGGLSLNEIVDSRLKEILMEEKERARGPVAKEGSMLGKVLDGVVPGQKIVFGVGRATGSFYRIQSYQIVGDGLYVQDASAYGDDFHDVVEEFNMIAGLLTPLAGPDFPQSPGICIDGAFIRQPPKEIHEAVSLGIRLNPFDDVHFSVEMTKKDRLVESDALEPRLRSMEADADRLGIGKWYKSIQTFRRGERRIGQWNGTEILARKPSLGDLRESHEFLYVSQGTPKDAMLPVLDIEMLSGLDGDRRGGKKIGVSDAEAIEIWDRLTTSIRPRSLATGAKVGAN